MVLEMLEWCLTPASLQARTSGLLAEQIAIRHRAIRCKRAWAPHLRACKAFMARELPSGSHIAILGSGHLRDLNLPHLKARFAKITLVDVVHPLEVRIMALFSRGRIQLLSGDLSGALHCFNPHSAISVADDLLVSLKEVDVFVSACLLTQLALPASNRWRKRFAESEVLLGVKRICQSHLDFLKNAPRALLITDVERRYGNADWSSLLPSVGLPCPMERWIWDIASPAEHGLKNIGPEQRRVEAAVL